MSIMPQTLAVERTQIFQDEWAIRYGVLMGGTKIVKLDGIGQFWVGHYEIPRRHLIGFTHQQVRGRNEAEDSAALDEPGGGLLTNPSPLEVRKLVDKSPALCMREMIQMQGAKGFINSQTLMGDTENADRICSMVMPAEVAAMPLVDVLAFMEKSAYVEKAFMDGKLRARAQSFREECLQGGYIARAYMTQYTSAISEEINQSNEKKTGKRGVDSVDTEYFWELKLTLPKDRPLEATTQLGKEIAGAMSKGSDNSAMVAEMKEANRLKAEELELRKLELSRFVSTEPKRGPGRPPRSPETE